MVETGDASRVEAEPSPDPNGAHEGGSDGARSAGDDRGEATGDSLERVAAVLLGEGDTGRGHGDVDRTVLRDAGAGDPWTSVALLHDFLDQRLAAGELSREEGRRLRRRLVTLSRTLAEEGIRSERRRSRRLIGGLSREIRGTLDPVAFLLATLDEGHSGRLRQRQREQVGIIRAATASVANRLGSLADWSRVADPGHRSGEEFRLPAVAATVRRLVRPLTESQGIRFSARIDGGEVCRGDAQTASRVALNLVAATLRPDGGERVELRLQATDEGLWVRVRDDGPDGAEEARRVAELFDRSGPRDLAEWMEEDGIGLEYAVCAALVRACDGEFSVEAREDERPGKRITVALPFPRSGDSSG